MGKAWKRSVVLSVALALGACSSIPPNTPRLVDLTAERVENQSRVLIASYQNVLDQAKFARDDAADAGAALDKLDATKLSSGEQEALKAAKSAIGDIQKFLDFGDKRQALVGSSTRVFEDVGTSLRTVRQVVATEVDKKLLVEDTMQTLKQLKGGEN